MDSLVDVPLTLGSQVSLISLLILAVRCCKDIKILLGSGARGNRSSFLLTCDIEPSAGILVTNAKESTR